MVVMRRLVVAGCRLHGDEQRRRRARCKGVEVARELDRINLRQILPKSIMARSSSRVICRVPILSAAI